LGVQKLGPRWVEEAEPVTVDNRAEPTFVDERVVSAAEQNHVGEARLAAVGPVSHVMRRLIGQELDFDADHAVIGVPHVQITFRRVGQIAWLDASV
jgi:hypothetical protein